MRSHHAKTCALTSTVQKSTTYKRQRHAGFALSAEVSPGQPMSRRAVSAAHSALISTCAVKPRIDRLRDSPEGSGGREHPALTREGPYRAGVYFASWRTPLAVVFFMLRPSYLWY